MAYTDAVQGALMLAGLLVLPAVAVTAAGGWGAVTAALEEQDPALLGMTRFTSDGVAGWIAVLSFLAIGLPFIGVPQLMVRYMSVRDERELGKARMMSVIVILLFDLGAVTAGMAGRALHPGLADPETIFPVLSTDLFPPVLTSMMMIVVLSAIMSTVDSLLILASSAVVRDGLQKIFGSLRSDATLAGYGRLVTIAIGLSATAFALEESRLIFWFVLFAWSGLGAAFGPVILCTLYDAKTTRAGVVAGMLGGFLTCIVWVLAFKSGYYELYEMIPGFLVGLVLTIVVSRSTRPGILAAPAVRTGQRR